MPKLIKGSLKYDRIHCPIASAPNLASEIANIAEINANTTKDTTAITVRFTFLEIKGANMRKIELHIIIDKFKENGFELEDNNE